MSQFEIGRPVRLPIRVAAEVAWKSIRVRFSRSLVTVSSVILAVAFLLVVIGDDISIRSVHATWLERSAAQRHTAAFLDLAANRRESATLFDLYRRSPERIAAWCERLDAGEPEIDPVTLARAGALLDWLGELKSSQRYLITRNREPIAWLSSVDTDEEAEELSATADTFKGINPPMSKGEFVELAGNADAFRDTIATLREAETRRAEAVDEAGGQEAAIRAVRDGADPEELAAMGLPVAQIFPPTRGNLAAVAEHLEYMDRRDRAGQILAETREYVTEEAARKAAERNRKIQEEYRRKAEEAKEKGEELPEPTAEVEPERSPADPLSMGAVLEGKLADHPRRETIREELRAEFGEEGWRALVAKSRRSAEIDRLKLRFVEAGFDPEGGDQRTLWLVVLSLLVCVVGIVNSMMMAVTERFQEIATMKCLGAVDSFILKAFMIESASIGLVGSVIGALLGVAIIFLQSSWIYGGYFWASLPLGPLALAGLFGLGCGLVLTILGALLPAWQAARMHPIEAMRLEG